MDDPIAVLNLDSRSAEEGANRRNCIFISRRVHQAAHNPISGDTKDRVPLHRTRWDVVLEVRVKRDIVHQQFRSFQASSPSS
ncbi:hypothetical protein [Variibacter gotjawalensis]|uniref:hypothetical protein n=1 Tax=Variibacter gotjawalensis TaxID=1333996 RepID=UPI00102C4628|nr:hypothetical protein [Variibacter gotjawalensis]NIK47840.1 hypothetical protein [Variibacter gotjawalensis]